MKRSGVPACRCMDVHAPDIKEEFKEFKEFEEFEEYWGAALERVPHNLRF